MSKVKTSLSFFVVQLKKIRSRTRTFITRQHITQNQIIGILTILLLTVGVATGMYLGSQTQEIRQRASDAYPNCADPSAFEFCSGKPVGTQCGDNASCTNTEEKDSCICETNTCENPSEYAPCSGVEVGTSCGSGGTCTNTPTKKSCICEGQKCANPSTYAPCSGVDVGTSCGSGGTCMNAPFKDDCVCAGQVCANPSSYAPCSGVKVGTACGNGGTCINALFKDDCICDGQLPTFTPAPIVDCYEACIQAESDPGVCKGLPLCPSCREVCALKFPKAIAYCNSLRSCSSPNCPGQPPGASCSKDGVCDARYRTVYSGCESVEGVSCCLLDPTNTPKPTNTSVPRPTNTSVPNTPGQPTNTPVPVPTNTSVPHPTDTPRPPTNTPSPTNTPAGPTHTATPSYTPGGPTITQTFTSTKTPTPAGLPKAGNTIPTVTLLYAGIIIVIIGIVGLVILL